MTVPAARRAYRQLLRLAPRALVRDHGPEMEDAFVAALRAARVRGRAAMAAVWAHAIGDLLAARLERLSRGSRPGPLSERRTLMLGPEIRSALRSFKRQKTATTLVVTMLTLGIAANIVVFSFVNALFLRPFPFPDPERLVYINEKAPRWSLDRTGVNYPDFHRWREGARAFEGFGLSADASFNLADEHGAERIAGALVTHDFLPTLGVRPLVGRLFTAEEDRPRGPRVALIAESVWRTRFKSGQDVLSKTLRLNGVTFQIVGVLPAHAEFPGNAIVWIPLAGDPNQPGQSYSYEGIGRLKPGITPEAAEQDLLRAHAPIWETRDTSRIVSPFVQPLRERFVADVRTMAKALMAGVALLLAVACANVAAVMLARTIARRREMGIRLAIGASRARLLRQLFVENVLLALAGGVAGVALGRVALGVLVASVDDLVPPWATLTPDVRLVLFAVLVTAGTTVLFGWAPALHAVRGDLRAAMGDAAAASTTAPRGRRTLTALVVAEFTLAALLIAGGALLFRAFDQIRRVDPGYRPDHVLVFSVSLPPAVYKDGPSRTAFWARLLERLRQTPGVEHAGAISCPPLTCHWGNFYRIEGRPPLKPGEADPVVLSRIASEGYFEAMGARLRAGRFFEAQDGRANAPPVVIVNDTFARTFWPGAADVLGKRMGFRGDAPWMTVIGVTEDVKHYGLDRPMRPGLYFYPAPPLDIRTSGMYMVVRTTGDPAAFTPTARAIVKDLDPTLPLFRDQTAEAMLATSLQRRATYSWMAAVFAGLALVLALGGAYGVSSYLVTQRTREIGIRLAIGARTADIVRSVLAKGLAAAALGIVLGVVGIVSVAGLLTEVLFGVSPRDPVILGGSALALVLAAAVANWLPARRAARTDAMISLRG
jgi:predicted permease